MKTSAFTACSQKLLRRPHRGVIAVLPGRKRLRMDAVFHPGDQILDVRAAEDGGGVMNSDLMNSRERPANSGLITAGRSTIPLRTS